MSKLDKSQELRLATPPRPEIQRVGRLIGTVHNNIATFFDPRSVAGITNGLPNGGGVVGMMNTSVVGLTSGGSYIVCGVKPEDLVEWLRVNEWKDLAA